MWPWACEPYFACLVYEKGPAREECELDFILFKPKEAFAVMFCAPPTPETFLWAEGGVKTEIKLIFLSPTHSRNSVS